LHPFGADAVYILRLQPTSRGMDYVRSLKKVEEFDPNGRVQTSRGTAEELGGIGIIRICQ
jgi:hypothetical protein